MCLHFKNYERGEHVEVPRTDTPLYAVTPRTATPNAATPEVCQGLCMTTFSCVCVVCVCVCACVCEWEQPLEEVKEKRTVSCLDLMAQN